MNTISFSQNLTPDQKKFVYPDLAIVATDGSTELVLVEIGKGGHWEAYTKDGNVWYDASEEHFADRGKALSFAYSWLSGDQEL